MECWHFLWGKRVEENKLNCIKFHLHIKLIRGMRVYHILEFCSANRWERSLVERILQHRTQIWDKNNCSFHHYKHKHRTCSLHRTLQAPQTNDTERTAYLEVSNKSFQLSLSSRHLLGTDERQSYHSSNRMSLLFAIYLRKSGQLFQYLLQEKIYVSFFSYFHFNAICHCLIISFIYNSRRASIPSGVRKSSCEFELNVPQSPWVFPR